MTKKLIEKCTVFKPVVIYSGRSQSLSKRLFTDNTSSTSSLTSSLMSQHIQTIQQSSARQVGSGGNQESVVVDGIAAALAYVSDHIDEIVSVSDLVRLAENSLSLDESDFGLLHQVVARSVSVLEAFSPKEFVALITLCSRAEFVDSDFSEAVQKFVPKIVSSLNEAQLVQVFVSVLKLGIDLPQDGLMESTTTTDKSPLLHSLVDEICSRSGSIAPSAALSVLHAILRKSLTRYRSSEDMQRLVDHIGRKGGVLGWPLYGQIQGVHALSRLGFGIDLLLNRMLRNCVKGDISSNGSFNSNLILDSSIPSANLQHLLSILFVHRDKVDDPLFWQQMVSAVVDRMSDPAVARSIPPAILATSIGYLGRFGDSNSGVSSKTLLSMVNVFLTGRSGGFRYGLDPSSFFQKTVVPRILSPNNAIDAAHLTAVLETMQVCLNYMELKNSQFSSLLLITTRLVQRSGVHNVRAAPLCQLAAAWLESGALVTESSLVQSVIDAVDYCVDSASGSQWNLNADSKPQVELKKPDDVKKFKKSTTLELVEGLLRHEQYIRVTPSVVARVVKLRDLLESANSTSVKLADFTNDNLVQFLRTVEVSGPKDTISS